MRRSLRRTAMIKRYTDKAPLIQSRWPNTGSVDKELLSYVKPIIDDVAARGDAAVSLYTERFDKVTLAGLKVTPEEVEKAYSRVSLSQIEALREAKRRLEAVESRRLRQLDYSVNLDGVEVRSTMKPIACVGCYVPGGKAAYPSSVLMNVVPAKVAGVKRVIICTPPGETGEVTPLTLVASDLCGVKEIYKIGGVQAVAAMAYGTESVPRVDKIVGPGNRYVTAAKTLVSGVVSIDKPAGPSEILVIADDGADPRLIALDMISQAEHGPGGVSGLVTDSPSLADRVAGELDALVEDAPRGDTVKDVLTKGGFILVVPSLDEAAEFADEFAPEHLEVQTRDPEALACKVNNAGLILLGEYTPVSSTDYCMGVNHVLPTEGYAKVSAGLTVLDYMKPVYTVKATRDALGKVRPYVAALATTEGLPNHMKAVEGRFTDEA